MSAPDQRGARAMLGARLRDAKHAIDFIYAFDDLPNEELISALVEIRVHGDRSINALKAETTKKAPGARA